MKGRGRPEVRTDTGASGPGPGENRTKKEMYETQRFGVRKVDSAPGP